MASLLHRINQAHAVDEIGGAGAGGLIELGQFLRRHGQVGIEDEENVAGGGGKRFAHSAALAFGLLLENFDLALRIFGGHTLDFIPGVVLGMALDENDLRAQAHFRGALDGGLDVPGFVARGNDDRATKLRTRGRLRFWPCNHGNRETKMRQERRCPAIQKRSQQRRSHRPENAGISLDDLPTGKMQEVDHVRRGKPVLQDRRRLRANFFRAMENGTPKIVEKIQDQTRVGRGHRMQPLENALDIGQVVDEVGEEDVIKLFGAGKFGGVGDLKFKLGMALAGEVDYRRAEIDAHAAGRFERGEKIAQAAPHFQHAQSGRDEEREIIAQQLLVITIVFPGTGSGPLFIKRSTVNHSPMLVTQKEASGERGITSRLKSAQVTMFVFHLHNRTNFILKNFQHAFLTFFSLS